MATIRNCLYGLGCTTPSACGVCQCTQANDILLVLKHGDVLIRKAVGGCLGLGLGLGLGSDAEARLCTPASRSKATRSRNLLHQFDVRCSMSNEDAAVTLAN
ncbi:hypothetical protein ARMGADRAFT_375825 [Armillaria gallica]|uniref:Uncharacterized protein n=1 Tax=Armillaria gallica TaxID=47427 RepID=A0A2H3EMZ7_ARMGA|nr:hypothetical protein ARMGADRAFT_375825 [Armillaria gallica]